MRFLIIFIFLITNSLANEVTDIKNLVINKKLKKHDELTFLDDKNNLLNKVDRNVLIRVSNEIMAEQPEAEVKKN